MAQRPALRVYSIPDGLKYAQAFAVVQTSSGFVWVGTSYGVSRYDGREFANLTRSDGLPHDSVTAIGDGRDGTVWLVTQEGLARVAAEAGPDGEPRVLPLPRALVPLARGIRLVLPTPGGLWLLSRDGLRRLRGDRLEPVPLPPGFAPERVVSLGPGADDSVWLAGGGALARAGGAAAGIVRVDPVLGEPVCAVESGGEIVVVAKEGTGRLSGGSVLPDPSWGLPPGLDPESAVAAGDAIVVTTAASGLAVLRRGAPPIRLGSREGLPSDAVNGACVDSDGLIWAATEAGLVKVFDLSVRSFPAHPPEIGPAVYAVAPVGSDDAWLGHSEGLSRLRGGRAERVEGVTTSVWSVLPLPGGDVLAATRHGLVHVSGGSVRRMPGLPRAGVGRVFGLLRAPDGRIWATTIDGAVRFRWDARGGGPVDVELFDEFRGEPLGETRGLSADAGGAVFVGTDSGRVFRYANGALERFGAEAGLAGRTCRVVLARPEGLWIGTDAGVLLLADGVARPLDALNRQLDDRYVSAMAPSGDGGVWLATTYGVALVKGTEVVDRLGYDSGLAGPSTTAENGVATGPDGRVWIGMDGGVTVVDPRHRHRASPAPRIAIRSARDRAGNPVPPGAKVPWRAASITFAYRSPTFWSEERTTFSERLLGYESAWSAPHRAAGQRYTNLPPGDYLLEVRAVSASGRVSDGPASLAFSVAAPWWRTTAARTGAALLLVLAVWGAVRVRTAALQARTRELEAGIAARTRELSEANARLVEARDRVEELVANAGRAQEDLEAWAEGAAHQVAEALGSPPLGVFRVDAGRPVRLAGPPVPLASDVVAAADQGSSPVEASPGGGLAIAARGAAGELVGVVAVPAGGPPVGAEGRRLLLAFARQLGGALETRALRGRLQAARSARAGARRELLGRGVTLAGVCPSCRRCFDAAEGSCPDDGLALESPGLVPLRVRERYRLERILGEGGMGTVYLAVDERLGREVALKVIQPERFEEPGMRVRFEREANAVARIQHPGVVDLHDSGELPDGAVYLVMERLVGRDLATVLAADGRGTPAQVASLVSQAASALAAAHASGVVHRDVKPANLFLVPSGAGFRVKVLDFGLAKPLGPDDALTRTGMLVGTPAYMAPEQVNGQRVTPATDLYSLAAVGWEALTGRRLIEAAGLGDIFTAISSGVPPAPSALREGLPKEVDAAFLAGLARDPATRPADVTAWAAGLAASLEAVPAAEPGWSSLTGEPLPG